MRLKEDITAGVAYRYCEWAVNETEGKVPHYVKLQCEQWLAIANDEDGEAYVDGVQYEKICKLLKLMKHPDTKKTMYESLDEYSWMFITAVLCTMCKPESDYYEIADVDYDDCKIRFYETALLEVARKNHKTFCSAVVFILLMLTEPRFSRFFSVAPDLSLSSELQVAIKKIIKSSPLLCDEVNPVFKTLRKEIRCLLTDSEYTPLAYSNDGMDGKLANGWLADEAGALDDYPVEAMRSSQIELISKLGIIISTQYPNDNNVLISEIDIAKRTLDGLTTDRRYFALLYEPDDELKHGETWMTDDRCLYQSNPVAVEKELIMDNLKKKREVAIQYPNKRENFLCKHCNILYKGLGVEGFIDIQKVKMCRDAELTPSWWQGRRVWVGLDLSMTEDNTSVSMATWDSQTGHVYVQPSCFIPMDAIERKSLKEKVDYNSMISEGWCFPCGHETIDYGAVERYIISGLEEDYGVEVVQVGYDRYNAISTVGKLETEGIECVEIKQHSSVLHAPTKWLKELILNKEFHYPENRLYEINFENARCTEDTNRNKYVNKKKSSGKVDMVVSTINALYLLQQDLLYGEGELIIV